MRCYMDSLVEMEMQQITHHEDPNSENLLYLNPGVSFVFSSPGRLALLKLRVTVFLYFELEYLPISFS
jgi:hypothetical protein